MGKVTEITGCFVETLCCTKCNWFRPPFFKVAGRSLPHPPRSVCPDCGEPIKMMVGQYIIKEIKGLFSKKVEYINFIRKQ